MSYSISLTNRYGRSRKRQGMGDIGDLLVAGVKVSEDPYLSEVICRASQLQAIKANGTVPGCTRTASGQPGGIGLSRAVVPLRAYVYAEQHEWVYAAVAGGVLGLPFLLGYLIGKG